MRTLADSVLSAIRPIQGWCGDEDTPGHVQMLERAIDDLLLRSRTHPLEAYVVGTEALMQALTVMGRTNEQRGPVSDAALRLLQVHPVLAAASGSAANDVVEWMITAQFFASSRFAHLDPGAYVDVLGVEGLRLYEQRLAEVEAQLPPKSTGSEAGGWPVLMDWQTLDRQKRLVARLIHRGGKPVAAEEGRASRRSADSDGLGQSPRIEGRDETSYAYDAARRWWLLACEFQPEEMWAARLAMFRIRPNFEEAAALHEVASEQQWEECRFEVLSTLEARPADAIRFTREVMLDAGYAADLVGLLGAQE